MKVILYLSLLYLLLKKYNEMKIKNEIFSALNDWKKHYLKYNAPRKEFDEAKKYKDFDRLFKFISLQEGGLSKDKNDKASKYLPPEPHKDGNYYHTNSGITWITFKTYAKKLGIESTAERFYNMNKNDKKKFVKLYFYIRPSQEFGVDCNKHRKICWTIGYMLWAGTDYKKIKKLTSNKDKYTIYDLIELIKIQKEHYDKIKASKKYPKSYYDAWLYNFAKFLEICIFANNKN